MKVTVIYTGNGDPIVHKAECADIRRDSRNEAHGTETFDANTLTDVAAVVYSDQIAESNANASDYVYDLSVKPCVRIRTF
jgi:hypothetical protein